MALLFDTDLLIDLEREDGDARRRQLRLAFVEHLLAHLRPAPITEAVTRVHDDIWSDLPDKGEIIGAHDLWIAATATACVFNEHEVPATVSTDAPDATPIEPTSPMAVPPWLRNLLATIAGAAGVYWLVTLRAGESPRWGALVVALAGTVVSWMTGKMYGDGRRLPQATRAQLRRELREQFVFGIPNIQAVYEVFEKAGDANWFRRERDVTGRFLHGLVSEAEWAASMRRFLRLD